MTSSVDALTAHRAPGVGRELASPGHDDDGAGRHEQDPWTDEPAEIAECKEERALAAVEMTAGGLEQAGGADDMGLGFGAVALCSRRRRPEQDRNVVEQSIRPGEFEEGVDEDQDQPQALNLPERCRGTDIEGMLAESRQRGIGSP